MADGVRSYRNWVQAEWKSAKGASRGRNRVQGTETSRVDVVHSKGGTEIDQRREQLS